MFQHSLRPFYYDKGQTTKIKLKRLECTQLVMSRKIIRDRDVTVKCHRDPDVTGKCHYDHVSAWKLIQKGDNVSFLYT